MAVSIADLFVSVGADVSAAQAGLNALSNQLDQTTRKFQEAAPAALALTAAGAAVATGFGAAVGVAASFEQAMANVRAVMSPTEATQFGSALGDLAVQLGQQTVFSAREAAAGIGELIKAGIAAPDVLNGAGAAALNLAAATGISVANAATIAAQTMNAFHKSASELTGVVDTLAGVANATAADMSDLQFGLQVVSATAQTMGLSFEDTATAIGVFVSAGETGATAGTGLRQMLLELMPTTKPARAEMEKLGLVTKDGGNAFFDTAGHVKNLAGISQVLQNALRGMSDQQRIAALNTLFTRDAINSATILANQGAEGINAYSDAIQGISAADTAATRLGTLQGALNNLGSSFETVQIIAGNLFLPVITEIAAATRGALDQFSNLAPELQRAIVFFAGAAGALASLTGGMVLLSPIIARLPGSFAALLSVLPRVALLFAPLALVAGVLVAAWQADLGGIQGIVADAFAQLPALLDNVGHAMTRAGEFWASTIVPGVTAIATSLANALTPAIARLAPTADRLSRAFQVIATAVSSGASTVRAFSQQWLETHDTTSLAGQAFLAVADAINTMSAGFEQGIGFVQQHSQQFGLLAATLAGAAGAFVVIQGAIAVYSVAVAAATAVQTLFNLALDANPIGVIVVAIGALAGALVFLFNTNEDFRNSVLGVWDVIQNQLVPAFQTFASGVGEAFGTFFGQTLPPILAAVGGQLQSLGPLLQALAGFFDAVVNVATSLGGVAGTALQGLFENVLVPGLQALQAALGPVQPQINAIGSDLSAMASGFTSIGQSLQPVTDFFTNLTASINGANDAIKNFQLPSFLTPGAGSVFGGPGGGSTGAQVLPASFNPNGGGANGGGAITVNVYAGPITGEGDEDRLVEKVAAALLNATRRGSPAVDNSGIPSLKTTFA